MTLKDEFVLTDLGEVNKEHMPHVKWDGTLFQLGPSERAKLTKATVNR